MDDQKIMELFFSRNRDAIPAATEKYGRYLSGIARNIAGDARDAEEILSDTLLKAWNAIPPARPRSMLAFLGKIARNAAIDRVRQRGAQKRGAYREVSDEVLEFTPGSEGADEEMDSREITRILNEFLSHEGRENRVLFLRRYWYMDDIRTIARDAGKTEKQVSGALLRMRRRLWRTLEREGIVL